MEDTSLAVHHNLKDMRVTGDEQFRRIGHKCVIDAAVISAGIATDMLHQDIITPCIK